MLRSPQLSGQLRRHVENVRDNNRLFLTENPQLYPQSPHDFGETHIKSIGDLRMGQVYEVLVKREEEETFQRAEVVMVDGIKGNTWGGYEIDVVAQRSGGFQWTSIQGWDMGLEPVPEHILQNSEREHPAGVVWTSEVYTQLLADHPFELPDGEPIGPPQFP